MGTRRSGRLRRSCAILGLVAGAALVSAETRNEWQQPDRVMADLGVRPGTRVADIGCGDGYFALRLDAEFHYLKYQVFFRFQKPGSQPAAK